MESTPEIKFNFDIYKICENNKILIDQTGNMVVPIFRLINDLSYKKSYDIQQIYNYGYQFDYLINNTKMKIDYEIYNNINPIQSILVHNKYIYDYSIFKAGSNYNIAQINCYYLNQIINAHQKVLDLINPLYSLVEKINTEINLSYDVSLSYEKRMEWKTYIQPLKDQYNFLNEQKNYSMNQIQNLEAENTDLKIKIPIFLDHYNRLVRPPIFIPIPTQTSEPVPVTVPPNVVGTSVT
jgi:hypothetical protein